MADAMMCKGRQEVSRAGKLLSMLCEEFCQSGLAHESIDKEE